MAPDVELPAILAVLRSSEAFSTLDDVELGELASACKEITYRSGEFVFREGGRPDSLFIVSLGRVKVLKHSSRGKEHIVGFFGPGEMFGSAYGRRGLTRWVPLIQGWLDDGIDVFAYFNNDVGGHAAGDAGKLLEVLIPMMGG